MMVEEGKERKGNSVVRKIDNEKIDNINDGGRLRKKIN